ncbi:MAG: diaminopimelate epimerase [Eggerthellaceae bacterium]|jgi:diaminopimelate epimerase|nr:diaminopimelate epimerase [Eggerthellaceae bacterium]MCH4220614.1 diaminopimelate epimerase [Eggerthellaceae bacterium]
MKLDFVKLQGLGNDFIFIDDFSNEITLSKKQVAFLCDRHFGIGADGVILVRPSKHAECAAYMHYINSDGTLAQMCGNGVRCFAKFLVDRGFVQSSAGHFVADTLSGPHPISFNVDDNDRLTDATVDMGHPILDPQEVPVDASVNAHTSEGIGYVKELPIDSPFGTFAFTCVSMGNPHAVCFLDSLDSLPSDLFTDQRIRSIATFDVNRVGSFFESHHLFPEKTNVEFVTVNDPTGISMRVFERGCGETLACGTGTCATNVALALTGRSGRCNDIHLRGGVLHIEWDTNDHVMMTGAAREVYEGSIVL